MSRSIDISPLQIEMGEQELWFRFTDPVSIMLEIPPAFEEQLRHIAEENRQQFEGKTVHLELENLTAISSRQLAAFVVEKCVDVGDKLPDSRIECQAFTKPGDEAAGERVTFVFFLHFTQAERANPHMCCARDRIGGLQGVAHYRRVDVVMAATCH